MQIVAESSWTEAKNARRFALIEKEAAGSITGDECKELAALQREIDLHLQSAAPLPLAAAKSLHDQLCHVAKPTSPEFELPQE